MIKESRTQLLCFATALALVGCAHRATQTYVKSTLSVDGQEGSEPIWIAYAPAEYVFDRIGAEATAACKEKLASGFAGCSGSLPPCQTFVIHAGQELAMMTTELNRCPKLEAGDVTVFTASGTGQRLE